VFVTLRRKVIRDSSEEKSADSVFLVNHTRWSMPPAIPDKIPVSGWNVLFFGDVADIAGVSATLNNNSNEK
jgi:hypothetical protein